MFFINNFSWNISEENTYMISYDVDSFQYKCFPFLHLQDIWNLSKVICFFQSSEVDSWHHQSNDLISKYLNHQQTELNTIIASCALVHTYLVYIDISNPIYDIDNFRFLNSEEPRITNNRMHQCIINASMSSYLLWEYLVDVVDGNNVCLEEARQQT